MFMIHFCEFGVPSSQKEGIINYLVCYWVWKYIGLINLIDGKEQEIEQVHANIPFQNEPKIVGKFESVNIIV